MILILDTETSDLFRKDLAMDDPGQPWIVQIAAELIDERGATLGLFSTLIKSEGRKIRDGASAVHGITTRHCDNGGVSELAALGMLIGLASQARYVVGHGLGFDRDVVTSILMRLRKPVEKWTRPGLEFVDTTVAATAACKLPSDREDGQYKWPSLDEACEIILGEAPRTGPHSALDDVQRTKRLFLALREQNLVECAA